MKMISELTDHDHVEGQFLVGNVSKGVNATGGSYFSGELRDASGTVSAKKWDATKMNNFLSPVTLLGLLVK